MIAVPIIFMWICGVYSGWALRDFLNDMRGAIKRK